MSEVSVQPPALKTKLIAALRRDLLRAQWTVEHLDTILSLSARESLMRDQRIPALVELDDNTSPAATLTKFFVLGATESSQALAHALPELGVDGLVDLGLARKTHAHSSSTQPEVKHTNSHTGNEDTYAALFDLRPHSATLPDPEDVNNPDKEREFNWWIASDLSEAITGEPLHPEHVLGIGGATMTLLSLTMRGAYRKALDVGCGCGIQALYLSTHCERVVATDLSERACALTSFNAALNQATIDVRAGSLFNPVAGEEFDLIVSNPPFVITPESVRAQNAAGFMEYRDGGMERDNLIGQILTDAPAHLRPGGVLQMLANWEIPAGCDPKTQWSHRVETWLNSTHVDAWVVQRDILDPARYVEMWIRDSGGQLLGRDAYERIFASWLQDFQQANVAAIGMGFITVKRPETTVEPVHVYDSELSGNAPRGVDVEQALATLHLPENIWDLHLQRASDVREERHYIPGNPDPSVLILHQGASLGRSIHVSSATSALVGASDGELSVGQITAAIAMLTGQETEDMRNEVEEPLRHLIRGGFLIPLYAHQTPTHLGQESSPQKDPANSTPTEEQ